MKISNENNNSLKVFFLTEGNNKTGLGHISRCMALYQAFQLNGIEANMIVNGDDSCIQLINHCNYIIFDWINQKDKLADLIADADIAIIDSYIADFFIYEMISDLVKIPVYFDDTNRLDYPKGIILNGAINANKLNYPVNEEKTYLIGAKYQAFRKAFWQIPPREINESVNNVLVTFGGNDTRNLSPKILKTLNEKFPQITKNIIVGKAYKNQDELISLKNNKTVFHYDLDDKEMIKLMLSNDICISSSGQTLQELAVTGIPTIAIAIADNQKLICNAWKENNFIEFAGWWNDNNLIDNVLKAFAKLQNKELRQNKSDIGKSAIDGNSCKNIVNDIIKTFFAIKK